VPSQFQSPTPPDPKWAQGNAPGDLHEFDICLDALDPDCAGGELLVNLASVSAVPEPGAAALLVAALGSVAEPGHAGASEAAEQAGDGVGIDARGRNVLWRPTFTKSQLVEDQQRHEEDEVRSTTLGATIGNSLSCSPLFTRFISPLIPLVRPCPLHRAGGVSRIQRPTSPGGSNPLTAWHPQPTWR
jgi:hypothetical protein